MGNIRNIKAEEFDASLELSQYAFQYTLSKEEIENRRKKVKPEQIWGYFEDEVMASKLHLFPYTIFLNEKEFEMGGVAGVATWPEYRRQGMVQKLLYHSLEVMKQNGQSVSMLAPFSFDFYRKYGWEIHGEYRKYFLETNQLPPFKKVSGKVRREQPSFSKLHPVYVQFAKKFNGMLKRDEAWWNTVWNGEDTCAVYYDESDEPKAYIMYNVKNKEMKIEEFVYVDEESRQGLWNYIRNHDSMVTKVVVPAPINDSLTYLLSDPNVKQEITTYFMFRIVDVEAFLKLYPFRHVTSEPIFIHVTDDFAPWNNATFQLQMSDGEVKVSTYQKQSEGAQCSHPPKRGITCDIGTLSLMMLGYKRPTFLHDIGRINVFNPEEVKLWEQLIPEATTFLYDYF